MDSRKGESDSREGKLDSRKGELDLREGKLDLREGRLDSREGESDLREGKLDSRGGAIHSIVFIFKGGVMQTPYIPESDAAFAAWLTNFSTLISADPSQYGLEAADGVAIANQETAFVAALQLATDPATRTKPSVAGKDAARAAALTVVRPYAIQIRNNLGVSNQAKLDLGLNIPDPTPTPIPAPASAPILAVIGATFGQHTLRYADENTPAARRKPFGAVGLELFVAIADAPVSDPAEASFVRVVTRQPLAVSHDSADNGRMATYFGRWITRTGLAGPWSSPVSYTIVS